MPPPSPPPPLHHRHHHHFSSEHHFSAFTPPLSTAFTTATMMQIDDDDDVTNRTLIPTFVLLFRSYSSLTGEGTTEFEEFNTHEDFDGVITCGIGSFSWLIDRITSSKDIAVAGFSFVPRCINSTSIGDSPTRIEALGGWLGASTSPCCSNSVATWPESFQCVVDCTSDSWREADEDFGANSLRTILANDALFLSFLEGFWTPLLLKLDTQRLICH
ncbi:hypothetical protein HanRHA438_Chr03g0137711 [Helianthus annuus]|nr:hypothetical protein HanRHA438_Chr03g0137711 [Helianthus annuus]